jgi:hypothetical protein
MIGADFVCATFEADKLNDTIHAMYKVACRNCDTPAERALLDALLGLMTDSRKIGDTLKRLGAL